MRERLAACRHSLSLQQLNRTVARLCSPSTGAVLRCAPPERPHVSSFALICSACRFLFSFSTNSSFFTVPPRCVSYSCQFAACFAAAAACRFWRAALRSCCVRVSRGMSSGRRRGRWAGHEEQATVIEEVSFAPPVRSGVPHALSKKCRWQCDGRVYAAPQLRLASRRKGESNERNERTITTTRKVSFSSFFFLSLCPSLPCPLQLVEHAPVSLLLSVNRLPSSSSLRVVRAGLSVTMCVGAIFLAPEQSVLLSRKARLPAARSSR